MSRQVDVMFCKIAMSTGMVTEDVAKKVLALCDKREIETGRRPLIGALFTKHNILGKDHVQRIYAAVEKRLGRSVGPVLAPVKGGRGGEARRDKRAKPVRPIDPKTLWLGVGGLLVFLGIVIVMAVVLMMPDKKPAETTSAAGAGGAGAASSYTPGGGSGSGPAAKAGPGAASGAARKEIPREVLLEVQSNINDARSEMSGDPEMRLRSLEKTEKSLRDQGYEPPPALLSALKDLRDLVKQEGGGSTDAGTKASDATSGSSAASGPAATPGAGAAPAPKEASAEAAPAAEKAKETPPEAASDDIDKEILEGK
jgi:hypothetical protein